jgi:hypothetical protein
MIIYVAGPMRGYDEENKSAFEAAKKLIEQDFKDQGIEVQVIIPHDIMPKELNGPLPMEMYIRADVEVVLNSSIVFMLHGWYDSVGASAEHAIAKWAKKQIRYLP